MVISPGAMTIRWTAHPKTNGIRATSGAPAAAWQPSATQVHLWKTPHGEATSGFVHLISDVVHFSPVPSSWSESNSSSLSNFMSPSSFPKLPISQKLECKFASNFLGIPDRFWTLKCAVQFLIQFLLSNFFGHESSIFKRLLKNWTVVWDPKTENWIVNWIVNLTGPAEKLDGPCRKIGWALRKNWTAPENWTGPGMSQLGAQGAAALDLGVWFGVGRLGIKCHASGDIRGPAGAQLRA